jgi:hypothetical protein
MEKGLYFLLLLISTANCQSDSTNQPVEHREGLIRIEQVEIKISDQPTSPVVEFNVGEEDWNTVKKLSVDDLLTTIIVDTDSFKFATRNIRFGGSSTENKTFFIPIAAFWAKSDRFPAKSEMDSLQRMFDKGVVMHIGVN